ncbi:unnamed protein product [Parascedosporium putredinis]|uniref:Uncharacterized protein n=1 Tax=Parascedosporium putredinis TaxID=1442378 RepID=A0A9P1MAC4_9PEZI|nr:unnamed protein product [Parascedosporium putredinis]CAI7993648.1 unnamed protein product [Parascedosporium putredinis]
METSQALASVLDFLCKWKRLEWLRSTEGLKRDAMESALNKCVIGFADIQIFTGLAILISGFAMLPRGLSSYHWQIVVQLAWFSSLTHLSMLSFLRNYLKNRPLEMWIRIFFTLVLAVMLMAGFGISGHFDWDTDDNGPSQYADCYRRLTATRSAEENDWTFGQVFPLILVAAPLTSMVKSFSGVTDVSTKATQGTPRLSADGDLTIPPPTNQNEPKRDTNTQDGEQEPIPLERTATPTPYADPLELEDPREGVEQKYSSYTQNSAVFQGILILAILSYLQSALYIVVDNPVGFVVPFINLIQALLFIDPIIQISWILANLSLTKIRYAHCWTADFLRFIILVVLTGTQLTEFFYAPRGLAILVFTSGIQPWAWCEDTDHVEPCSVFDVDGMFY